MEQKTLEEKLYNVMEKAEKILENDAMTEYEYKNKVEDLLLKEGVVDHRKGIEYNDPTSYIAERFIYLGGPFNFHKGLNSHYVSGADKKIKSTEIKEDISNYQNVYERAKEYALNIELENVTENELIKDLDEYIINQEEVKNVKEGRKIFVTREMVNGIRLDTGLLIYFSRKNHNSDKINYKDAIKEELESLKKNDPTFNGFTRSQLNNALDNVNKLKKDLNNYNNYNKKIETDVYRAPQSKVKDFLSEYFGSVKA